ncbi:hypothetical protein MMYC01_210575 [Madurella mycetomatis]|uniref:Uncharacterized protein n=1 Tax=Madurella mycetomatis TaxID=100816 RepID=A0A175VN79_9PEZI|nr:hypothetical protein MMYC01_210575 [Madurella mycetomatis]
MEPFAILAPYGVLVCTLCRRACVANEAKTHLASQHAAQVNIGRRRAILAAIAAAPVLYRTQADLDSFPLPTRPIPAIDLLEGPFPDGLGCRTCPYVARQTNPVTRGGNVREKAARSYDLPWDSDVACQRFFSNQGACGWFRVEAPARPAAAPPAAAAAATAAAPDAERGMGIELDRDMEPDVGGTDGFLDIVVAAYSDLQRYTTGAEAEDAEGKNAPSPWLRRVGWARHLGGFDWAWLRRTVSLVASDGWPAVDDDDDDSDGDGDGDGDDSPASRARLVQLAWDSVGRVVRQAQRACTAIDEVGLAVLFEVNRKELGVKPPRPFDSRLEPATTDRYINVWKKAVGYLLRTSAYDPASRPAYRLTLKQRRLLRLFSRRLRDSGGSEGDFDRVDRVCLDLLVALLDHPLLGASYDSVLLSALAALGVRDDGGWLGPEQYTPIYSAVVKVARMLVVRQAQLETDEAADNSADGADGPDETDASDEADEADEVDEARAPGPSLFRAVRAKVRRFMTTTHSEGDPTPMDWVFEARSYRLRIAFTTAAKGLIHWRDHGRTVVYRDITLSMDGLAEMLHALVRAAGRHLDELLFAPGTPSTTGIEPPPPPVPPLDWEALSDDVGEERVGYSFLQHPANGGQLAGGEYWLVRRLRSYPPWRARWFQEPAGPSGPDGTATTFRSAAVKAYLKQVDEFRALLLVGIHLLGGQPARSTELLGLRHYNTMYAGRRNITLQGGMVRLEFLYHKGYLASGQIRLVYRYLPRELGELLVRYL